MTCQKTKSKLGNRRVRLELRESFKNVASVFDCGNHSHSQIVRGRKIKQPPCFVCSSTEREMILAASAEDWKYLGIQENLSNAFESKQDQRNNVVSHNASRG
jgi:hypothetical protein